MSSSTLPRGGGPGPAPPAPSLSGGGDNDHDDFSPLLDLLQTFPDRFETYALERLDPTARASLARTGSAFWDVVYSISIFPFGLPRARTTRRSAARASSLWTFSEPPSGWLGRRQTGARGLRGARGGHLAALRWAREHGCPWDALTSCDAARGGHLAVLRWAREHDCPWNAWNVVSTPLEAGTWRCCGRRGSKTVRGTR